MLPADPLRTNLPPSGARPWSRFRQGSMHGSTNVYNDQTLANTALPFGGAASWAVHTEGPGQGMNLAQSSQPVPFTQAHPQHGFSPSLPMSPFAHPYPQTPPNSSFPQAQPFTPMPDGGFPQSQPYPQMPLGGGYAASEPLFPQQPFPQQSFPPAQPTVGFYPANMGNNDIALASDAADTPSTGMGNVVQHKPSPLRLPGMDGIDGSRTDDIPAMPGIPGMPDIPDTPPPQPRLGPETNSEAFPALDDPFLRNPLNHYMQNGKSEQEGEPWDEG